MKYRRKVSSRGSKRLFSATAMNVHPRNVYAPSRGGIRL